MTVVKNEFVRSKHHRRANEEGIRESGPDGQFAFATLADIER